MITIANIGIAFVVATCSILNLSVPIPPIAAPKPLAIDAELKGEGYDPRDEEFYQEIDNRIKKAFSPDVGETEERVQESTSTPAQVVSGSSRLSPSSSNKVKLSKEDVYDLHLYTLTIFIFHLDCLYKAVKINYTNIQIFV